MPSHHINVRDPDRQGHPTPGDAEYSGDPGILLCWVVVAVFAVINLMVTELSRQVRPGTLQGSVFLFFLGVIGAELGLHSVWCVFAPVRPAKRLAVGIVTAAVLVGAWTLGFVNVARSSQTIVLFALCLPLVAIAAQLPLWLMRVFCGWRIVDREEPSLTPADAPFRIRDIFIATGVVALALSSARLAIPDYQSSEAQFWIPLAIFVVVVAAVSMLTTLPAVVATLRARRLWLTLLGTLLLDVAVMLAFVTIIAAIRGRLPRFHEYFEASTPAVGFCAALTGTLAIARRQGYRLLWGKPKAGPIVEESP